MKELTRKQRALYQLSIAEWIIISMQDNEYYPQIREIIDLCWAWLQNKQSSGDDIYFLIDDGTEFGGIFVYMQVDKDSRNKAKWNCILEACASIATLAYENEGEKYLPSLLEDTLDEDNFDFFDSEVQKLEIKNSQFIEEVKSYIKELSYIDKYAILTKIKSLVDIRK